MGQRKNKKTGWNVPLVGQELKGGYQQESASPASRYPVEATAEEGASKEAILLLLEKSTVQSLSWKEAFNSFMRGINSTS